jgi:hypothetical protein
MKRIWRQNNKYEDRRWIKDPEKQLKRRRDHYYKNRERELARLAARSKKISDLIAVLRVEMPELLKEFGL